MLFVILLSSAIEDYGLKVSLGVQLVELKSYNLIQGLFIS